MVESQILAAVTGSAGVITLDRPRALNALTTAMIEAIDAALGRFAAVQVSD